MSKQKYSKSFEIALSAISCSIAVAFLWLGTLSGVLLATGYFVAIIALMIPLSKQFYFGDFLAYLGTCILTLVLGAVARFWELVPFIMFFGLHPLINALQLKFKINRWLALIVKALWFDATLIAGYFLVFHGLIGGSFLPQNIYDIVNQYFYILVFTAGSLIFFVYDYLIFNCQLLMNKIVLRIRK